MLEDLKTRVEKAVGSKEWTNLIQIIQAEASYGNTSIRFNILTPDFIELLRSEGLVVSENEYIEVSW